MIVVNKQEQNTPAITAPNWKTELETDEENWEDGQLDNTELLNCHNSTEKSNRIHCEYSAYFEKLED